MNFKCIYKPHLDFVSLPFLRNLETEKKEHDAMRLTQNRQINEFSKTYQICAQKKCSYDTFKFRQLF